MMWQILRTDADYTIEFWKTFKYTLSDLFNPGKVEDIISSYSVIYGLLDESQITFNNAWIQNLFSDYPSLVDQYIGQLKEAVNQINHSVSISRSSNVAVYDANNKQVAYIRDGKPYASGNVSIVVEGAENQLHFYDNQADSVYFSHYFAGYLEGLFLLLQLNVIRIIWSYLCNFIFSQCLILVGSSVNFKIKIKNSKNKKRK